MQRRVVLALAVASVLGVAAWTTADDAEKCPVAKKCEAVCPISGHAISKDASVDYRGGKVYFCCAGCVPKFNENKEKYSTKANQQLVVTGQFTQVGCPLSGGKCNPDSNLEVGGVKVCFCCNGCKGKVAAKEGDAQLGMVFADAAFDKSYKIKSE